MKIKTLANRKCLLEFDEFYSVDVNIRAEVIDAIAAEFAGCRKAYNMWEFENREKVDEFIFMYRLKYENKT
jgi:hypothetical protein